MPDDVLIQALEKSKIFIGLSRKELQRISTAGDLCHYEKNAYIIHEGQTGGALYLIVSGSVEVFLPQKSTYSSETRATRIRLNQLTRGDGLGEYSLIDDNPSSASALALESCTLFKIPKLQFERLVQSDDRLAKVIYGNMLRVLIKRARIYNKELDLCIL